MGERDDVGTHVAPRPPSGEYFAPCHGKNPALSGRYRIERQLGEGGMRAPGNVAHSCLR